MEVRKRLGLKDFMEDYEWVYEQCLPEQVGNRQIIRWVRKHSRVIKVPRPGAIFYVPSDGDRLAMAVVVDERDCLFLGPGKSVVRMAFATVSKGKFYWSE